MEFQPDYLVSWDFSDKDYPSVIISKLYSDGKSAHLSVDVLEQFQTKIGVCSLRQLISEFEHNRRTDNGCFD